MSHLSKSTAAYCVLGAALAFTGCKPAEPPPPTAAPTTMAMPETNMKTPGPSTMAIPAEVKAPTPAATTVPIPEVNGTPTGPTTLAVPVAAPTPAPVAPPPPPAPVAPPPPAVVAPPPPPAPAAPTVTIPAAKDFTHTLAADSPYFLTEPGATTTPAGTLKAGSKVLVLIPGATYSQVITDTGISAYAPTAELKPLGK